MENLKKSNPERVTGYEKDNNLPNIHFVRRFASRHSLTLRKSLEISKGRAVCSVSDLEHWQEETFKYLVENPKFLDCFSDPRRVWNQDESSIECGISGQKVLAPIGAKIIYTVAGSTREHVTTSFTVSAAGDVVPPRTIHKGVRNVAATHLQNLPNDTQSGQWTFSVSEKGFINRELFLQVLIDLDNYLNKHNIKRPIILFYDGASPHISIAAAEFCSTHGIQPWLFKPNFTHLLQPLDLSFFASLKKELKKLAWTWQTKPSNTGQVLNKYSVIGVLHSAVENCLSRINLIPSGFKRAGLFPWDRSAPDKSKLNPSKAYSVPLDSQSKLSSSNSSRLLTSEMSSSSSHPLSDISPSSGENSPPLDSSPAVMSTVSVSPQAEVSSVQDSDSAGLSLPSFSHPIDMSSLLCSPTSGSFYVSVSASLLVSSPPLLSTFSSTELLSVTSSHSSEMSPSSSSSPPALITTLSTVEHAGISVSSGSKAVESTEQGQTIIQENENIFGDISNFDPPLSSTLIPELQSTKTFICTGCNRRILLRFQDLHSASCQEREKISVKDVTVKKFIPTTLPVFTIEERKSHLLKFEVLLLTPGQTEEFTKMFLNKLNCDEPLFLSWLSLKSGTIETEEQAIDSVLSLHTAKNVPKRITKRKMNVPDGGERYDPSCTAWVDILKETDAKKRKTIEAKNVKNNKKQAKENTKSKKPQNTEVKKKPKSKSQLKNQDMATSKSVIKKNMRSNVDDHSRHILVGEFSLKNRTKS